MKLFKWSYLYKALLIVGLVMAIAGLVMSMGAENKDAGFAYAISSLLWITAIFDHLTIEMLWKMLRQCGPHKGN